MYKVDIRQVKLNTKSNDITDFDSCFIYDNNIIVIENKTTLTKQNIDDKLRQIIFLKSNNYFEKIYKLYRVKYPLDTFLKLKEKDINVFIMFDGKKSHNVLQYLKFLNGNSISEDIYQGIVYKIFINNKKFYKKKSGEYLKFVKHLIEKITRTKNDISRTEKIQTHIKYINTIFNGKNFNDCLKYWKFKHITLDDIQFIKKLGESEYTQKYTEKIYKNLYEYIQFMNNIFMSFSDVQYIHQQVKTSIGWFENNRIALSCIKYQTDFL